MHYLLIPFLACIILWLVFKNWPKNTDVCDHDWSAWKLHDEQISEKKIEKRQIRTCSKCGLSEFKGITI